MTDNGLPWYFYHVLFNDIMVFDHGSSWPTMVNIRALAEPAVHLSNGFTLTKDAI